MATPIIDHNLLTLDYWQDSVTYEGKSIEYRSVADLKAAIAEVEATMARESGAPQSRQIRVTTSKAL